MELFKKLNNALCTGIEFLCMPLKLKHYTIDVLYMSWEDSTRWTFGGGISHPTCHPHVEVELSSIQWHMRDCLKQFKSHQLS